MPQDFFLENLTAQRLLLTILPPSSERFAILASKAGQAGIHKYIDQPVDLILQPVRIRVDVDNCLDLYALAWSHSLMSVDE